MSIVNVEALKQNGCVLHWPGSYAESGAYDDDGNKRGFLILPDGVTVTPNGTFTTQKMKDGRGVWKFDGSTNFVTMSNHSAWEFGSGDFTICYWENRTTDGASNAVLGRDSTTLYVPFLIHQKRTRFASCPFHLNIYSVCVEILQAERHVDCHSY